MNNRFKELREKKLNKNGSPMSIRALAKELEISPSHISELERGILSPSLLMLTKYHRYFNVTMEYLMGEDTQEVNKEKDCSLKESDALFKRKLDKGIDEAINTTTKDENLEKQLIEFLFTTTTGKVLIHEMAGILFGVNSEQYNDADILQNNENSEYNMIHHEPMDDISRRFANALVILRDPLYRKMSYNELQLVLINTGTDKVDDTYSKRCTFE